MVVRKLLLVAVAAFGLTCLPPAPAAEAATHRFGVGANYWTALGDIDVTGDINKNGLSYLGSYQYVPAGIFRLELNLEYYPSLGQNGKAFWSPEAFVLVGGTLYAGVGIGDYFNGDVFSDTPFFMLRAGVDFAILPFLSLDINANYRFNNWDTLKADDIDTNTIRLGAAVRLSL
jgi:hypothetical protein